MKEKNSQKSLIGKEIDSLKLLIVEKVRFAHFLETKTFAAMNESETN